MILDPLHGDGYQLWSGIAGDVGILAAIGVYLRHHNCHVRGCPRMTWHNHPDHGHPVCRRHHPDVVERVNRRNPLLSDRDTTTKGW